MSASEFFKETCRNIGSFKTNGQIILLVSGTNTKKVIPKIYVKNAALLNSYFTVPKNIGRLSRLRVVSPLRSIVVRSGASPRSPTCWVNA